MALTSIVPLLSMVRPWTFVTGVPPDGVVVVAVALSPPATRIPVATAVLSGVVFRHRSSP
jgi:hypothetical protein